MNIELRLHDGPQTVAFHSLATEILYGGAAGGGKSHLIRVALVSMCVAVPGLQCYLFRRHYQELVDSHLNGPGGFLAMLAPWIEAGVVKVNLSDLTIEFTQTHSRIRLCHCQHEHHVYRFKSAEIHVLAIDELTQFSEFQYTFLRGRVRFAGLDAPTDYRDRLPRVIAGTNPGDVGHNWVKAAWIDEHPPFSIWRTPASDGGMLRQFIPARLGDNPTLADGDPTYRQRLEGLSRPELVRAMLEGDWNIVAGGALDDIWTVECAKRIVVEPFELPKSWRLFRAFDWGSSKPFSVGWYAVADGTAPAGVPQLPRGSLVRFAELYGWNGKPNEGSRRLAVDVAREIFEVEKQLGLTGRVQPGPADSAIYAAENGQCIAEDMARIGVRFVAADKSPGSRKAGLERVRKMLRAATVHPREEPCLVITASCRHALRTLPTLPRDAKDPDDVDTDAEDHLYDEVRYACMAGGEPQVQAARRPW